MYDSDLDRIQKSEVELHGSGFGGELSLGRCNYHVGEVRSYVDVRRISQQRVGYIVNTDNDG